MLAIIPARKGSSRLPGKNLMSLRGKSLLQRACDTAVDAGFGIVITTDYDPVPVQIETRYFMELLQRPLELATATAGMADVVLHVLKSYPLFDSFVLLQPTSPLRTTLDLIEAKRLFFSSNANTLVSVSAGSQRPNGAIYMADADHFLAHPVFLDVDTLCYEMPVERSIDIDRREDFEAAEQYLGAQQSAFMETHCI